MKRQVRLFQTILDQMMPLPAMSTQITRFLQQLDCRLLTLVPRAYVAQRRRLSTLAVIILLTVLATACGSDIAGPVDRTAPAGPAIISAEEVEIRRVLAVPDHFETPYIPPTNMPTDAKVELGRRLFYDRNLSGNREQSCADCHDAEMGFADGLTTPTGSTGQELTRNSMSLANVAYYTSYTWGNNVLLSLEDQIRVPLLADAPIELGVLDSNRDEVLQRFDSDADYARMFAQAFTESTTGVSVNKIIFALATFMRTMISGSSPYDDYLTGNQSALNESQIRGLVLMNSEKYECHHCHRGINFSTSYRDRRTPETDVPRPFVNTGLYNVDGENQYPAGNQGVYEVTLDEADRGRFRPQGLRNIALSAPYMHDGSIATLREVVEFYIAGGRNIESGTYAGDGRANALKTNLVRPITDATEQEIQDILAFLQSLTDTKFVQDPRFRQP